MARRKCARWSSSEKLRPEMSADAIGIPPELGTWPRSRFAAVRRIEANDRLVQAILPAAQARGEEALSSTISCLVSMARNGYHDRPAGLLRQRRQMTTEMEAKRARLVAI